MKNTTIGTLVLLLAALCASAQQYSYNFTAPVGAITCARVSPYQQWYSNLVENSTPPYPNALQPNNFHMPAFPNHPMPGPIGSCNVMPGFTGDETGVPVKVELSGGPPTNAGELRIDEGAPDAQVVIFDSGVWNVPSPYPLVGQATTFTFNASITQVCTTICQAASGQLTLSGDWAFHWAQHSSFRWTMIQKDWTNVTPVTIQGLSTVAILDQNKKKEPVIVAGLWQRFWHWFTASEPVEIFF